MIVKALATILFTGYSPVAPGTVGTLAAVIAYLLTPESAVNSSLFFIIPVLAIFPAVYISGKAEEGAGMQKDDRRIVIDEFVGYFISVLFLPKSFVVAVAAFVLFRLFDIIKPPPIFELQSLKKGWGIMMDDVMAGIYTNLLLQIGYFLLHSK